METHAMHIFDQQQHRLRWPPAPEPIPEPRPPIAIKSKGFHHFPIANNPPNTNIWDLVASWHEAGLIDDRLWALIMQARGVTVVS